MCTDVPRVALPVCFAVMSGARVYACVRLLVRPLHWLAVAFGGAEVVEPARVAPWIGVISTEALVVAVGAGASFVANVCAH